MCFHNLVSSLLHGYKLPALHKRAHPPNIFSHFLQHLIRAGATPAHGSTLLPAPQHHAPPSLPPQRAKSNTRFIVALSELYFCAPGPLSPGFFRSSAAFALRRYYWSDEHLAL
eukprot:6199710-Pleurochrysis_carterae.AAC.2